MNQVTVDQRFAEFKMYWAGKGLDFDHAYGFQCMDVAEAWKQKLQPGSGHFGGNAIDLLRNGPAHNWRFIHNGPSNFPPRGALVIFNYGIYGHVAVAGACNVNTMNLFQQNNPIGSVCHMSTNVSYAHVIGWIVAP